MGISRRAALQRAWSVAGAAVAGVRPATSGRPADASGRRGRPALRRDAVHRLQDLRGRVQRGERPAGRYRREPRRRSITRRSISARGPRPSSSCTARRQTRSFVKAQCMHCVDPACASACMLGALKKREFGIVTYEPGPLRRLPLLRGRLSVRRAEVRVGQGGAEDRQVRAVQGTARGREGAGVHRGLPAPRGHLREAQRICLKEAKRRIAEQPGRYVPKVYGETDGGGTQVLYLSHVPFEKLGLPDARR